MRSLDPGWNEVTLEVGSRHPFAPALEEGLRPFATEMMPGMREAMQREGYDPDRPFLTAGNITPRPVRFIADAFSRRIGSHVARALDEHAMKVK